MANFAPLVGEALPAYGLPRPAFPYEEGDANKSTPHMKWLPINYARPAKCNAVSYTHLTLPTILLV